jgi:hypothetical protein
MATLKQSSFILEVLSPDPAQRVILPETGLAGQVRALEVGSAPYNEMGLTLNYAGLADIHFFLKIENTKVLIYHEAKASLSVNGKPLQAESWQPLNPGGILDCGNDILMRLSLIYDQGVNGAGVNQAEVKAEDSLNKSDYFFTPVYDSALGSEKRDDPLTPYLLSSDDNAEVEDGPPVTPPRVPLMRLRILNSRYNLEGQVDFSLKDGELVEIGREPQSSRRLYVNDKKVSKRHAYILVKNKNILLHDGIPNLKQPSLNGTFIFDQSARLRLSGSQPNMIKPGTIFQVGYTEIILEEVSICLNVTG